MKRISSLRIERLVFRGYGLARLGDGKVVFVPFVVPGDLVDVELVDVKKDYAFARLLALKEPSSYRVEPKCEHFGMCGGCQWQNVDYKFQVSQKLLILERELRGIADGLDIRVIESPQYGYRRRALLKSDGKFWGFYRFRSSKIVPVGRCPVLTDGLNKALLTVYSFPRLVKNAVDLWLGETYDGSDVFVSISSMKKIGFIHDLYHAISEALEGCRIHLQIRYPDRGKISHLGPKLAYEEVWGVKLPVSHRIFFQSNRYLLADLVEGVVRLVPSGSRVLELYAGSGTFSIPLSGVASEVVCVESNRRAVNIFSEALDYNRIGNVYVLAENAEDAVVKLQDKNFDTIIVDPPRSGCTRQVIEHLSKVKFEKIIYISCNPTSFARDYKLIRQLCPVRINRITMLDLFPNTYNMELVVEIVRD